MSPWQVITNPFVLRRLGKLSEEVGELIEVVGHVANHGIHSAEPDSGVALRDRLTQELGDVYAQLDETRDGLALTIDAAAAPDDAERRMPSAPLTSALGHLSCVVGRVIIQGLDEIDPATKTINRVRLQHAIESCMQRMVVIEQAFGLDAEAIAVRQALKRRRLVAWEQHFIDRNAVVDCTG